MPEISPSCLTARNPQLTLAARNITASALTGWTNYREAMLYGTSCSGPKTYPHVRTGTAVSTAQLRGVNGTSATIDSHSGTVRVVENKDRYAAAPPPRRTGSNQAQGAAAGNHHSGVRHLPLSRCP
jgi:hypothetical protein